ncbi:MAG: hypothetical protein V4621_07345 [Pseudomonadota bacterium]
MTHRILTFVFLSLTLAFAPVAPVFAQAQTPTAQSGSSPDPTCDPEVWKAMEAKSEATTTAANDTLKEAVNDPAPTAGLSCQDKIMGSWAKIGSIFSDTGTGVSKKLIDHTKTFVMAYLAKYLVGNFDIGGFQFDFNFMQSLMSLTGGFGTSFDKCDVASDYAQFVKGRGDEIRGFAQQKMQSVYSAGNIPALPITPSGTP